MTNARKYGYVQDMRYSGFAGAKTGYVKWRKWQIGDEPDFVTGYFA